MSNYSSCIRCGKIRIVSRTWTENNEGSAITYTLTVCPDRECQKLVDADLAEKQNKMKALQDKSLHRRETMKRVARQSN